MAEKKPVALWKDIVGTALSGTVLLVLAPLIVFLTAFKEGTPLWAFVTVYTCIAVCIFSLIISIINLSSAITYKRIKPSQREDKTELLHQLLSEGKITIEEYDRLKK